ncbi:MAG: hypothetical protein FGM15_02695 [Chthoniobacterales bacterium]|nr:hypothetical protein [Chthoniobacterales bacterium]
MIARISKPLVSSVVAVVLGAFAARAGDDMVFTADLPFDASQALPVWMHGPPVSAPGAGARVAFRLSPPADRDLLVHFVFDETEGGGLRVEWLRDGSGTPEVISENLGEGLGVPNQRPLLISASRLGGNGTLLLQGGANLNVNRVKFEWVSERTMLASTTCYVPVVVTASRLTLAEADVDGGPRRALQDEWRDRVVRAALTEGAELLTPSLELVSTLEQAPTKARLEASFAGVFFDQEVWLLINNQEVGPMAIDVPTLEDPGHLPGPDQRGVFAGWRKASIHIPAELLLPGENSVLLELRSPVNSNYRNRTFVRDAVLELSYPPPVKEPDLSLPLRDVPVEPEPHAGEEAPLPPVVPPSAPGPADALNSFWQSGAGSF